MLLQLLQHLLNGLHMLLAFTFGVDEDVIKLHYHKNIKFLCQSLVYVTLEGGQYVGPFKRPYLVLKIAIAGPNSCLPFIACSDFYPMAGIGQIKLVETSSPTLLIHWFSDQR